MLGLIDSTLVGEANSAAPQGAAGDRVLVLGVGNLLMGDEGVGIHILRLLEHERPVAGVRLLDGGTGGVNLLTEFDGADDIVLIDATRDAEDIGATLGAAAGRDPGARRPSPLVSPASPSSAPPPPTTRWRTSSGFSWRP